MSIVYIVLIIIAIALVLTLLVMGYVKAAPDEAIIISGFFKNLEYLLDVLDLEFHSLKELID